MNRNDSAPPSDEAAVWNDAFSALAEALPIEPIVLLRPEDASDLVLTGQGGLLQCA